MDDQDPHHLRDAIGWVDGWPKAAKTSCCGPKLPVPPPPYPVTDEEEKAYRRLCDRQSDDLFNS